MRHVVDLEYCFHMAESLRAVELLFECCVILFNACSIYLRTHSCMRTAINKSQTHNDVRLAINSECFDDRGYRYRAVLEKKVNTFQPLESLSTSP